MARVRQLKPELTEIEAAEFRGLFFGEGHLDLARQSSLATLYPRARIAVRDDDAAVLDWCKSLFGGNITKRASTRSVCWQLSGRARIAALLDTLEGGGIPSKKRAEVVLMREAWSLGVERGYRLPPENFERLVAIRDELKELRAYRKGS